MTPAEWRAAGAALTALDDVSVLLLIGESTVALAAATRGVASAVPPTRRVAVFDLAGAFGADEPDGLIAAFREGRSLNALARPLEDGAVERFVVARGPGVLDVELAAHIRWPRLVQGFRSMGALLVIALPQDFACARALAPLADRVLRLTAGTDDAAVLLPLTGSGGPEPVESELVPVLAESPVSVEVPAETVQEDFGLVGSFDARESAGDDAAYAVIADDAAADAEARGDDPSRPLPRTTVGGAGMRRLRITPVNPSQEVRITPVSSRVVRRNRRRTVLVTGILLIVAAFSAGGWYEWHTRPRTEPKVTKRADSLAAIDAKLAGAVDTLQLPSIVNPGDSLRSSQWSVELVATNDRADANFRLAEETALPAGTLSPVLVGDDSAPWYKIVAGAFVDRTSAELLRRALRQVGTIEADAGVVARVPFALRLDTELAPSIAKTRASAYVLRGVAAYALMVDDEHAAIYTGAFASPGQSVLLLGELRTAGLDPQLVYRVGRTY